MATSITYTNFEKLLARGDEAIIAVKLMMAFNDLAVANEGLAMFKTQYAARRNDKDRGAAMYFIRLQAGHLCEAMDIIDAIERHDRLVNVVKQCSASAQSAYNRLVTMRAHDEQKRKFRQYFERLRNNLTFHYDESGKLISRAMERRAKNPEGNLTSMTRGTEAYSWRFKIADDVVDSIVCRDIWKIADDADLGSEADAAADYGHAIFIDFADFASEFLTRYIRDGA